MTKGRKHLDSKEYETLKMMLDAGAKVSKVAKAWDRSGATLRFIKKSKDWKDYKNIVSEYVQSQKKNKMVETFEFPGYKTIAIEELNDNDKLLAELVTIREILADILNAIHER